MTGSSEAIQAPSDSVDLIKYDGTHTQTPPEENIIDVTWKLSYSSHTPHQLSGSEIVPGVTVFDFTTTSEQQQMIGHDHAEVIRKSNGVNLNHTKFVSDCIQQIQQ
jgi:hypothetical protein